MTDNPESINDINDICSVCLNHFEDTNVCETQCHHNFCKTCLDEWFNKKISFQKCMRWQETNVTLGKTQRWKKKGQFV